jgi:large subunit ribosomal protein L3
LENIKRKRKKIVSIGILGKKIGMTQIFDQKGDVIPVTVIKVETCILTQIKSEEDCGYTAIQIGYLQTSSKKISKSTQGHLKKQNLPCLKYFKEFRVKDEKKFQLNQEITLNNFNIGEKTIVTGLTIGKGNCGNIKRNKFNRGPMTHGSKHHRAQGSLGAGTTPGRVFPGKKMAGRLGNEKRTIFGVEIIDKDLENNLLVIKGSVPGKMGNLISIRKTSEK